MPKSEILNDKQEQPAAPDKKFNLNRHSLAVVVLASIFAGFLGGFASTTFLSSRPGLQKSLTSGGLATNQKVIYEEDSAIIDVVEKASPAVVSIVVSKDLSQMKRYFSPYGNFFDVYGGPQNNQKSAPNIQQVGAGSGFFVSSDGLILTNRHVVADTTATYSIVTNNGKTYDAKVLSRDSRNDLALIKVEISNAPVLPFADSDSVQIGQQVLAIGNSLGQYQNTVTSGIVSGIGRSVVAGDGSDSEQLEGVIQTDAAINPGNSGGPLLNLGGQVIGINTAIDQQGQLVGFAIPAGDAQKAIESFKKSGKISYPFLGVRYLMLDDRIAKAHNLSVTEGALILGGEEVGEDGVLAGSPADKAGFKEKDVIIEVEGHRINSQNSLARELKNYNVGQKLEIKVNREGKEQILTPTLEESK